MSSAWVAATVSEHGSAGRSPQKVEKTYEAILNEGAAPGLPARTARAATRRTEHARVSERCSSGGGGLPRVSLVTGREGAAWHRSACPTRR